MLRIGIIGKPAAFSEGFSFYAQECLCQMYIIITEGRHQADQVSNHLVPDGIDIIRVKSPADKVGKLMIFADGDGS